MAYRDEQRCHICGELTRTTCPRCQNPVCADHTLAGRAADGPARARADAERLARRLGGMEVCTSCLEREIAASQGPFVAILRTSDPIQTQMIVEALLDEGYDARAIGTQNAALLGAGQNIFEQRIEVPEPQAEAAGALAMALLEQETLEELAGSSDDAEADEAGAAEADEDADDEDADDEEGPAPLSPRRRGIAAGLAFIFPGASHYYARHPWTGMFLTATFFAGLMLSAREPLRSTAVLLAGAPLLDLVAGQLAVGATNRGAPRSTLFQLVQGAAMAAALGLLAAVLR